MANPRQRRKARSAHKPVHHSRQAKKLLKKQPRALDFFVDMSALPTLTDSMLIKPFGVPRYCKKYGTNIKRSDKSTYTQSTTGNVG